MELEIKVPSVGESITEVTLSNWLKNEGDIVEQDEILAEIESDKASFEVSAESAGKLSIKIGDGETIAVGTVIATIDTSAAGDVSAKKDEPKAEATKTEIEPKSEAKTESVNYASGTPSPAAAKTLSEKGIDPSAVNGSGKDGRITKVDANKAEKPAPEKASKPVSEISTPVAKPSERNTRSEKMSTLRKTIARRLVEVKNQTAMLTTFNEVDMSAIMEMRKKYKDTFKEKHNVGLGFMSLFAKACVEALKEFPAVNGQLDGENIIFHDYADVGIAVSTPRGLVVPVLRNVETMSLADIEKKIIDLAGRARDGKISIDEMQGGTFTITNGGVFGSLLSTPILNAPQSAILGMHNIVERPMAVNGQVVIRPMMYVALSYDHRIVDGRESVSFLVRVKQMLEDPYRMLLEV
ncbi:MAG: 2-oxoglutarate dehydrogenase complex dihydrolipoyllysine-residue succinyltransferase [Bacteroidota bacterium]|nr:2-oxoglutarate dehydrogenase complex dihydrolipoyllysine-residue succinyltransferase [Bacteroidota bacterium]